MKESDQSIIQETNQENEKVQIDNASYFIDNVSQVAYAVKESSQSLVQQANPGNFSQAGKTKNHCKQILAQKIFDILQNNIPDIGTIISVTSITMFFKQLKQKAQMIIEEDIIAVALLQKFILKQEQKGAHVLSTKNIGTMLVVLAVVAMKTCRDDVYKNSFFAREFGLSNETLNKSESSFLRVIDHELSIDTENYSQLYNEIMNVQGEEFLF
ncbi:MAG: hypothetical protein EZS28_043792 [Streblomastix strix]|uniref:Cyclin N-terminal domain-containing protein n=1 Tax=Streblomastix strix TaxID=222440 RepID=A0A5J4TT61_9EUKA|nr:MAG: hypothetical protein EZS28_043792 [Streblomastix strix]